ncbi:MAG: aspartate--tRNA ligase [Candidatus Marinimicrobia bacterium]|nr:aspartate--tRNA ligase [Candidatus Neomarinimicrobiota bacterium]RPG05205.1 MAG: aspartate--tRNA ligase [Pelagibacteraceae bacterium TMED247]|tara:strand:- start:4295 stop:6085 length:1791 start_codon:yes stop_codon:yes gene_type:complete
MNKYRSHNCSELNKNNIGKKVKLSGWVHRKRDHGNLLFVDLRDHFGLTQCVIENKDKNFKIIEKIKPESVISIEGIVVKRSKETENKEIKTGMIEVKIAGIEILSKAKDLPMPVFGEQEYPEETRLKYRFIDLRRNEMHENIKLRSKILSFIRSKMIENNFLEFQTPILTASSPEGARDFLVPSRVHPGKFYALPQAPQQFKQMVMISGFDRYFQIAPCFRDEDGRADRSPGEHYQLDMEMAFVEQEDIFKVVEPIFFDLFKQFGKGKKINKPPFPKIKYRDSLEKYGTDKPDLRNPIQLADVTEIFKSGEVKLKIFKDIISKGGIVKAIPVPNTFSKPRSFFDNLNNWAISEGASGLAYVTFEKEANKTIGKGPIAKFFSDNATLELLKKCKITEKDSVFFVCNKEKEATRFSGIARQKIAEELKLIDEKKFNFCWITDYPMYEYDETEKKIDFSHNPFSMPQVNIDEFDKADPLKILAYQYDLVCNGYELSSGAIRNHIPEYLFKVFEKVGYSKNMIEEKFSGMIKALSYGAPPHGGMAPGIDRIVMLLAEQKNIREVTLFPLNQNAEDLLMEAPSDISEKQLKELNIKIIKKD